MKRMKLSVCALSVAMLLSSCGGMTNTAKGGLIGGTSGGALGALVGQLIGKGKGAAIGAAVGTAVGAGAGVLIGHKMDKAKKAAEAANAGGGPDAPAVSCSLNLCRGCGQRTPTVSHSRTCI